MTSPWRNLADDEAALVETLARFATTELAPKAAATDETATFVHEQLLRQEKH